MGLFGKKNDDLGLDDDRLGLDKDSPSFGGDHDVDPFSHPSTPPLGGQQPMRQQPAGSISPLGGEFSNPDLNSVTGSPRPRERDDGAFMSMQPQEEAPRAGASHMEKDLQIIIAKLDAVKSELDSLHQRVQRIERIAEADQAARERKQQSIVPRW